jgi:DNA polymerase V
MIALIDCNNFYVSCERLFDPTLAKKPVIVLSNNDGCAISRSEEAKALGIQMAQPAFMINDNIARDVRMFSSNYTLYGDISARVMQVIKEFVPFTEVYSIDEIFADLTTLKYKDHTELAKEIRETVLRCTGIPVTVGIGPTKTLAKMANRYAKKTSRKEGVFAAATPELINKLLAFTEVGGVWGIGKQHEAMLKKNGFHNALQLLNAPAEWIRKNFSVVGQRLQMELNGIQCIPFEEGTPARKNICTSRSFGQLVSEKKQIKQAIAKFTSSCAEKLRRENSCAKKLNVFIQTNPHRPTDPQYFQSLTVKLPVATNVTTELIRFSTKALDLIFKEGYQYQKCGVIALDLIPQKSIQMGMFDNKLRMRDQKLMNSIDDVNRSFGRDLVRLASQEYDHGWKLKQDFLSQHYTTRFDQLPKAKAS